MNKKYSTGENIAGIIFLSIFFSGFIWLIGSSHEKDMRSIDPFLGNTGIDRTSLIVDHSTCGYILPGWGEYIFGYFTCPSCMRKGKQIAEKYRVSVQEGFCSRRGENHIVLEKK